MRRRSCVLFVSLPLLLLAACTNSVTIAPIVPHTAVPAVTAASPRIETSAITFPTLTQTAAAPPRLTPTASAAQAPTAPAVAAISRLTEPTAVPATPATTGTPLSGGKATAATPPAPVAQKAITAPSTTAAATVGMKLSGSQLVSRTFLSTSLGREMPYFVYLPVGYAESGKRYPVLYMLHGFGGSNTEWLSVGFPEEADREMNTGQIPQMLIVFPQGDQAYWVNHANGGERWGDYAARDVVAQIDGAYRTIPDAPHRGIGGLSMGAHGALQLALNYPGTFGVVGMHSPTLRDFADTYDFFGDQAYFDAHDPAHLAQQYPDRARKLKIFVDIGAQDAIWHDKTVAFHDLLTRAGIPHEFRTWPGDHNGMYWGPHSRDYLHFYGANIAPS